MSEELEAGTPMDEGREPTRIDLPIEPVEGQQRRIGVYICHCGGNISEAARRLGLHRRSLQRKLQKYPPAD